MTGEQPPIHEWHRGEYTLSTDPARLDRQMIYEFLRDQAYWAQGRPREVILRSIENSENFGVYRDGAQVAFARIVTDYATFAYLCDVFVLPVARGQGLGKWMMACMLEHPGLQGLKLWYLKTRDAHGLYRQFGFHELEDPSRSMERRGDR